MTGDIIPFAQKRQSFSYGESPEIRSQETLWWVHKIDTLLRASVSHHTLGNYFRSQVHYTLAESQKHGKDYFEELLYLLGNTIQEENGIFLLPTHIIKRCQTEKEQLSVFERKHLLQNIQIFLSQGFVHPGMISAYNWIYKTLSEEYPATLLKHIWENPNNSQESDVIYLSDLLTWAGERNRFYHLENTIPDFTRKIDAYKTRVQSGIWNLTNPNFSPVFDQIFALVYTILSTPYEPDFSREEILWGIQKLSEFECKYLIDGINRALYPEHITTIVARTAYLHLIRAWLLSRGEEMRNQKWEMKKEA